MLFISCHLEAHDGNLEKRNEQWHYIHSKFVLKEEVDGFGKMMCMPKKEGPKLGKKITG